MPDAVPKTEPTEAEVVLWLKRALRDHGLAGRAVREILVDADGSYLRAPFRRQLEPTGTIRIGDWRPDLVCVLDAGGAERPAGCEVKSATEHERGIIGERAPPAQLISTVRLG